ncbi:serine/threonine protein kinase [Streptomyces sp. NBC_01477]|uniref:serine/threonine protein kinase n=1 Tax=Streptomyces sp. NBC_01477 TaxID=2976015 RepID=UPI002E32CFFC|nr:serine/threonine-protein kinase [Streptomyces sp. NBC_01477]
MGLIKNIGDIEETYDIHKLAGSGGQAELYIGYERSSGRKAAVKVQNEQGFEPTYHFEILAKELTEEGEYIQKLSGTPGIPRIFAFGRYRNLRCIVMEFIEGTLLTNALESVRPVRNVTTVASIIGQLCEILDHVHHSNLVHRDVKPDNVMVEPDGCIRLFDLGLAVEAGAGIEFPCGTMGFAPPEQLNVNPKGITGQADIFALGSMLMEMTVMQRPYGGTRAGIIGKDHPVQPVLPPGRLAALPPELAPLALRMVDRDPGRRPATVREVFDALRPHLPVPGSCRPRKPLRPDPTEYYRTHTPTL